MPGKSGITLLEEWQQQGLEIPVIIMTGHGNIDLCRRAFKSRAFEFLTKPIDADLLIETVAGALEHQRMLQQQRQATAELQERLIALSARELEVTGLIMQGNPVRKLLRSWSFHRAR